jgi:hypothetical protein
MTRTGERILIGATIVAFLIALAIPLAALALDGMKVNSGPAVTAAASEAHSVIYSIIA